jgi:hypothetical protein
MKTKNAAGGIVYAIAYGVVGQKTAQGLADFGGAYLMGIAVIVYYIVFHYVRWGGRRSFYGF